MDRNKYPVDVTLMVGENDEKWMAEVERLKKLLEEKDKDLSICLRSLHSLQEKLRKRVTMIQDLKRSDRLHKALIRQKDFEIARCNKTLDSLRVQKQRLIRSSQNAADMLDKYADELEAKRWIQ